MLPAADVSVIRPGSSLEREARTRKGFSVFPPHAGQFCATCPPPQKGGSHLPCCCLSCFWLCRSFVCIQWGVLPLCGPSCLFFPFSCNLWPSNASRVQGCTALPAPVAAPLLPPVCKVLLQSLEPRRSCRRPERAWPGGQLPPRRRRPGPAQGRCSQLALPSKRSGRLQP